MSKQEFKTHCRIIDYVEQADPELARIMHGVCVDQSLGVKGKPGVTFLMPQDKDFIKKLSALAYSANVDDSEKANDMINNLIIKDVFKTPGEWVAHKDDIPNALFPSQSIEVDSVSGDTVIFKSGAKATIDKNFRDASKRKNLAIWKLTGEIPVTTDRPSNGKYIKAARAAKTGGYAPGLVESQNLRFQISRHVEREYILAACNYRNGSWFKNQPVPACVYNKYVASLVNWMMNNGHSELVREVIVPQISFDILDFYVFVEPHRRTGSPLLASDIISGWWSAYQNNNAPVADICALVQSMLKAGGRSNAMIYTDRKCLAKCINSVREEIMNAAQSKPRLAPVQIEAVYNILDSENRIKDARGVYPDALAAYYRENAGLKLLQDELRYLVIAKAKEFENTCDMGAFHEMSNLIAEAMAACNKDERAKCLSLLHAGIIKFMIAPNDRVDEIKTFVYSCMFLYMPCTEEERRAESTHKRPQVNGIPVPNVREWIYSRYTIDIPSDAKTGGCELTVSSIERMDFESLSDEIKEALKRKLGA